MRSNTIFLHIPKCGGSTLHDIMHREYGKPSEFVRVIHRTDDIPSFIALPEEIRHKVHVLIGHGRYGLHEYLCGESRYITFLRDPIDRALSAYYYDKSFAYSVIWQKDLSLRQYYEGDYAPWDKNIQTKKIAGVVNDMAPCTDKEFDQAMHNLKHNIDFVGFVEYFDESLMALKSQFAWRRMPYYRRRNITRNRRGIDSIAPSELDLLREVNVYDMKLYAYAEEFFSRLILEESIRSRAAQFQRWNRIVGKWLDLTVRGKDRIKRLFRRS